MVGNFNGHSIGEPLDLVQEQVPDQSLRKETKVRRRWLDKVRFDFTIKVE